MEFRTIDPTARLEPAEDLTRKGPDLVGGSVFSPIFTEDMIGGLTDCTNERPHNLERIAVVQEEAHIAVDANPGAELDETPPESNPQ